MKTVHSGQSIMVNGSRHTFFTCRALAVQQGRDPEAALAQNRANGGRDAWISPDVTVISLSNIPQPEATPMAMGDVVTLEGLTYRIASGGFDRLKLVPYVEDTSDVSEEAKKCPKCINFCCSCGCTCGGSKFPCPGLGKTCTHPDCCQCSCHCPDDWYDEE